VPDFVEMMLVDYYYEDERALVLEGLAELDRRAQSQHGVRFARAGEADQIALLQAMELEGLTKLQAGGAFASPLPAPGAAPPPAFFQAVRELVAVGYCSSEVAASHGFPYDPWPGSYEGCAPLASLQRRPGQSA
jgi:hypothetical protein